MNGDGDPRFDDLERRLMARRIVAPPALRDRVLAGVHVALGRRPARPIHSAGTPSEWLAIAAVLAVAIMTFAATLESVPAVARVRAAVAGCTVTARARRAGVPIEHVAASPAPVAAGVDHRADFARGPFTLRPRDGRRFLEETF
jgi:hypothetical protein